MKRRLQKVFGLLMVAMAVLSQSFDDGANPLLAEARVSRCSNQLKKGQQDFFYCSKFAVAKGKILEVDVNVNFKKNYAYKKADSERDSAYVTVAIYNHQQWQRALKIDDNENDACKKKQDLALRYQRHDIPMDGRHIHYRLVYTTPHKAGPQMYYTAVMDCEEDIHYMLGGAAGKIDVQTHMHTEDSEFSYEKNGIITTNVILLIIYSVIFALNYQDWSNFTRRHDLWNTPHIYCLGAMVFQVISVAFELQSNILFSNSGEEYIALDIISSIFSMINECVMILMLLMIANGWMTKWTKYDFDDGIEIWAPLFLLVLMIHICFAALSYIDKDAYHKYHDFQGWAGFGLLISKFFLVGIFFYFYSYTKSQLQKGQQAFFEQIIQVGLIYMLSDPILLVGTYLLSEWNMAFYYNIADQLMHLFLQCYFLYQLKDRKSRFTKSIDSVSTLPMDGGYNKKE